MANVQRPVAVFDAVGTLISVASGVGEIYEAAGREHGSRRVAGEIVDRFHWARSQAFPANASKQDLVTNNADQRQKWHRIVSSVFDDVPNPDRLFEQLWNTFAEPSTWKVYPDVERTLERLATAGFIVVMGSNFDSRLLRIVAGLPALKPVQHVFASGDLGYSKPSPHFFHEIETRLSAPASACTMIGDDIGCDWRGAAHAGWCSWLIDRQQPENDIDKRMLCDLSALPDLLTG